LDDWLVLLLGVCLGGPAGLLAFYRLDGTHRLRLRAREYERTRKLARPPAPPPAWYIDYIETHERREQRPDKSSRKEKTR
jgi:hypothetical protein